MIKNNQFISLYLCFLNDHYYCLSPYSSLNDDTPNYCTINGEIVSTQSCVLINGTKYPTGITLFSHVEFFGNGLVIQYQSANMYSTTCNIYISTKFACPIEGRYIFGGGSVNVCNIFSGLSGLIYGCFVFGLEKTVISFQEIPIVSFMPFDSQSETSSNILVSFSTSSLQIPNGCTTNPQEIYIQCSNVDFTILKFFTNSDCNPINLKTGQILDFSNIQDRTKNGLLECSSTPFDGLGSFYYHNFGIQPPPCPSDSFACQVFVNKATNQLQIKSSGISYQGCGEVGWFRTFKFSLACNKNVNYQIQSFGDSPMCTYNLNVQSKYACQLTVSALYYNNLFDNYIDLRPLKSISSVSYQSCINSTIPLGTIDSQQYTNQKDEIDI
ncbi:hypothetical protein ACTA71_000209 [Dictyostelium dimigraforme]